MALIPINVFDDVADKFDQLFQALHLSGSPRIRSNKPCGFLQNPVESNPKITNKKFQINIDVQHFAPDEINVKVIDGFVVIEGKHDEKSDEHGFVSRQFVRRFKLPQGCLPDTVESQLSSDGVLTVTAPKVLPLPSKGEKIVPIKYTG